MKLKISDLMEAARHNLGAEFMIAKLPSLKAFNILGDDDDDDDDDDDEDYSQIVKRQSPYSQIASQLYNADYKNRIIVIDGLIDMKCFVYAKMIEDWNRCDLEAEAIKPEILEKRKNDKQFDKLFSQYESTWTLTEEELSAMMLSLLPVLSKYPDAKVSPDMLEKGPTPIKIKFNSPGGYLLAYQTLADAISLSKTKVIGINMGLAASAAACLLVACDERLVMPRSRMMIHKGSGGYYGSFEQTDAAQKNYAAEVNEMITSIQKKSKIKPEDLKEYMNPDWYFSAEEAVKYGLADRIIDNIEDLL